MPRGDGTGPMGTGPVGWGRGPCGMGLGRLAGPFGGYRSGGGRWPGLGLGRGLGYSGPTYLGSAVRDERAWLEAEAKRLEALLLDVRSQIRDYQAEEDEAK